LIDLPKAPLAVPWVSASILAQCLFQEVESILTEEQLIANEHAGGTENAALDGGFGVFLECGFY
jgi:hypothetical protein